MASPLARFVATVPEGAVRCGDGKLKIAAPNAAVASLIARMVDVRGLSEMVWAAVLQAFDGDEALVATVSAMRQPRLLYTVDATPALKGKVWRVPFSAYLFDDP